MRGRTLTNFRPSFPLKSRAKDLWPDCSRRARYWSNGSSFALPTSLGPQSRSATRDPKMGSLSHRWLLIEAETVVKPPGQANT